MNNEFEQTSFLFGKNALFLEKLYQLYLVNPQLVDPSWYEFFQSLVAESPKSLISTNNLVITEKLKPSQKKQPIAVSVKSENKLKCKLLISAYRERGHYLAKLDPLNLEKLKTKQELRLTIEDSGYRCDQLDNVIEVNEEFSGLTSCSLKELVTKLDQTYAGSIGAEFSHIDDFTEKEWLFKQIENGYTALNLAKSNKQDILKTLTEIEVFEHYLHTKFQGAKRFSIEGGDNFILTLNKSVELAANFKVEEVIIGMAHRGRLCTLTQVIGKPYKAVFSEFIGNSSFPDDLGIAGDVKYHLGYSSDRILANGHKIHLSLSYNPSHLEAVNTVVAGRVRAKQDFIHDFERKRVLGILIHGDAAFCGQGVVAEGLMMSSLNPYKVGGILHFIINNQIGFTANNYDTKSGRYVTEIAKIIKSPIIHVNGDDAEATLLATTIAMNYRQKFAKDAIVDIVCYRKYGHNEADEPMYTQSSMYNVIKTKKSPAQIYANQLISQGIIEPEYFAKLREQFKLTLDQEYNLAKTYIPEVQAVKGQWSKYGRSSSSIIFSTSTGFDKILLKELGLKIYQIPKNFALNPKLVKLFENKIKALNNEHIDWAIAEQLAFASLLFEQFPVRLTGQDCERGTFSHRHSVLHDQRNSFTYVPLNNLSKNQAKYFVADSNLSEYGVLGFEYGYSSVNPQHLVLWEAQYGDFANGAQIIFDQFISSSETKWLRLSGIVVLLPHGYEGQGPDHSSARIERFLQLAAEDNMQITYPTTPASYFHLLRRQIHGSLRKPLIIMAPKSALRNKLVVSSLDDLDKETYFQPIIDEVDTKIKPYMVKKTIFCTGKVYYDLIETRLKRNITNTVIIRLEQLYPFAENIAVEIISQYNKSTEFIWCQEEPKNMGSWLFINNYLNRCLQKAGIDNEFKYIGRDPSASSSVGHMSLHILQQQKLIKEALA